MKRVGNNQWPLMFDASLEGGRISEKWPLYVDINITACHYKLKTTKCIKL